MSVPRELRFRSYNTRRNLPAGSGRKRGEANFLGAFIRSFIGGLGRPFVYGRYFAVPGCGIADLVLCQFSRKGDEPPSAVDARLLAFESKLSDWRKALQQAYRYRYYADVAVVLLPSNAASRAIASADVFRRLGVALWTFDPLARAILTHVTPSEVSHLNPTRRIQALATIRRSVQDFRGRGELSQSLLDGV